MKTNRTGNKPHSNLRSKTRGTKSDKSAMHQDQDAAISVDAPAEFESHYRMSAQAADLCAEQRGFHGEAEFKHWLEVEAEIDSILMR